MTMVSANEVLQTAQAGNANGNTVACGGFEHITFDVTASGLTGTVNFEGSVDGTTFYAIPVMNSAGAFVSTATASGLFHFTRGALKTIRARTSGVSAGSVTVTARMQ